MTKELLEAADLIGLISDHDCRIGIKPNLVAPADASWGATTHPEIVAGIIEYLQDHGCRNLVIAEGSWVGDRTEESFEVCGYRKLSEQYGVPLLDAQKDTHFTKDCDGLKLELCSCVKDIDYLINVPVLKGHCQTKITCALKNMKGASAKYGETTFSCDGAAPSDCTSGKGHPSGLHCGGSHLR